jgi:spermidine/putrescine transport system permease protein
MTYETRRKISLLFILIPGLLWIFGLLVIPQFGMFILSFQSNLPWVTVKLTGIEGDPKAAIEAVNTVKSFQIPSPAKITDADATELLQTFPVEIGWNIPEPRAEQIQRVLNKAGVSAEFIKKRWMLSNYLRFFQNAVYWTVYVRTILAAFLTTFASLVVSFPVAFYIAKIADRKWRSKLLLLLLIPFWVSELIRIFAWLLILGEKGIINQILMGLSLIRTPIQFLYTNFSVGVGLIYGYLLFMILPIYATLDSLDYSLIEAAQDLGANKFKVFTRIVFPYSLPGVVSGNIMVFMLSIGTYIVPKVLGGKSSVWFAELIYGNFIDTLNWEQGSAFAFILLISTLGIIFGLLRIAKLPLGEVAK